MSELYGDIVYWRNTNWADNELDIRKNALLGQTLDGKCDWRIVLFKNARGIEVEYASKDIYIGSPVCTVDALAAVAYTMAQMLMQHHQAQPTSIDLFVRNRENQWIAARHAEGALKAIIEIATKARWFEWTERPDIRDAVQRVCENRFIDWCCVGSLLQYTR